MDQQTDDEQCGADVVEGSVDDDEVFFMVLMSRR